MISPLLGQLGWIFFVEAQETIMYRLVIKIKAMRLIFEFWATFDRKMGVATTRANQKLPMPLGGTFGPTNISKMCFKFFGPEHFSIFFNIFTWNFEQSITTEFEALQKIQVKIFKNVGENFGFILIGPILLNLCHSYAGTRSKRLSRATDPRQPSNTT